MTDPEIIKVLVERLKIAARSAPVDGLAGVNSQNPDLDAVAYVLRGEAREIAAALTTLSARLKEAEEVRDTLIAWGIELLASDPECGSHKAAAGHMRGIIERNRVELRRIRAEKAARLSRAKADGGNDG